MKLRNLLETQKRLILGIFSDGTVVRRAYHRVVLLNVAPSDVVKLVSDVIDLYHLIQGKLST